MFRKEWQTVRQSQVGKSYVKAKNDRLSCRQSQVKVNLMLKKSLLSELVTHCKNSCFSFFTFSSGLCYVTTFLVIWRYHSARKKLFPKCWQSDIPYSVILLYKHMKVSEKVYTGRKAPLPTPPSLSSGKTTSALASGHITFTFLCVRLYLFVCKNRCMYTGSPLSLILLPPPLCHVLSFESLTLLSMKHHMFFSYTYIFSCVIFSRLLLFALPQSFFSVFVFMCI